MRWRIARSFALAVSILAPPAASASERFSTAFQPDPVHRNVFFASFDATERSRFLTFGVKRAIRSTLDEPGWRALTAIGVKIRDYDVTSGLHTSRVDTARLAIGREFRQGATLVTPYLGVSVAANTADVAQRTRRTARIGPVALIEVWHDWPGKEAWSSRFTTLIAMADHANRSAFIRLRHGLALSDGPIRFGPEISLSLGGRQTQHGVVLQESWVKTRLGLHVSEIPLWRVRLQVSGGAEWRDDAGTGAYGQIGAYIRY
jgi:hypothetical protein